VALTTYVRAVKQHENFEVCACSAQRSRYGWHSWARQGQEFARASNWAGK